MDHGDGSWPAWLLALESSGLAQSMRQSVSLYPLVETVHIFGFVLLAGGIALFDLRLLGFGRSLPVDRLARLALPVPMIGFAVALPTGALLFVTEATAYAGNPLFLAKLGVIGLALANILWFHLGPFRTVEAWGSASAVPARARLSGLLSLALWFAVIACGRLIAYV